VNAGAFLYIELLISPPRIEFGGDAALRRRAMLAERAITEIVETASSIELGGSEPARTADEQAESLRAALAVHVEVRAQTGSRRPFSWLTSHAPAGPHLRSFVI
jgi:hypothetical protein